MQALVLLAGGVGERADLHERAERRPEFRLPELALADRLPALHPRQRRPLRQQGGRLQPQPQVSQQQAQPSRQGITVLLVLTVIWTVGQAIMNTPHGCVLNIFLASASRVDCHP